MEYAGKRVSLDAISQRRHANRWNWEEEREEAGGNVSARGISPLLSLVRRDAAAITHGRDYQVAFQGAAIWVPVVHSGLAAVAEGIEGRARGDLSRGSTPAPPVRHEEWRFRALARTNPPEDARI